MSKKSGDVESSDQPQQEQAESSQESQTPEQAPAQSQIKINDSSVISCYANFCRVSSTPEELILDLGLNPTLYAIGEQTSTVMFSRAIPSELRAQLQGLGTQQQQITERTLQLEVPSDLTEQHESLLTTMQLRTNGLNGLAQAFGQLGDLGSDEEAGLVLAQQASRLTASDVVYADLFEGPTMTILAEQDVQGVEVPSSVFVTDPDTYTQATMTELLNNLGGGSDGGGLRGTSLISVTAQPDDLQLSPHEVNQLNISTDLAFEVVLRNSGDVQLTDVRVRLTLQQDGGPIRQNKTIDVLNPDQERIVTFTDFSGELDIAVLSNLIVSVPPVDGESNLDNNSASYQIILSLS